MSWRNIGPTERIIRIFLGLLAILLTFVTSSVLPYFLGVVGLILVVTGASGFCLVYRLLGIRTNGRHHPGHHEHPAA